MMNKEQKTHSLYVIGLQPKFEEEKKKIEIISVFFMFFRIHCYCCVKATI